MDATEKWLDVSQVGKMPRKPLKEAKKNLKEAMDVAEKWLVVPQVGKMPRKPLKEAKKNLK